MIRRAAIAFNALFVACLTAVHLLDRDPDPLEVSVSYYALTAHGWLATTGFLALAVGSALVARLAWRSGDRVKAYALAASSLAVVVLSIFPCDPWYPWERAPTTGGAIHALAACVPIVLLPLVAFRDVVLHVRGDAVARAFGFAMVYVLASAAVGTYILGALIVGHNPTAAGLAERAVVLAGVAWLSAVARTSGPQATGSEAVSA